MSSIILYFHSIILFSNYFVLFSESCFAKDIHVSGSPASKDDSTCGSTYQPCASIAHALHISKDSDRILLNTFFEHVSNDSLKITNAVTISTYQTVSKTQRAVLRFQNRSSYPEQCIFKISNNVSFSSIEIVHKVEIDWAAFLLVDPCQRIIIKHCIFRVIDNELEIFSLNRNLTEIYVTDTNFIGQRQQRTGSSFKKSVPNKKKSIPGERTMPMGSQRTVITFNRCSFVNISFSFVYSEQRYRYFFVNNSAFIESEILVVNWWKSYFTNDTFRSSSLFIVSGNSTFKHCHFQRTKIDDSSLQYQLNVGDPSLPPSTFYVSTHIENCTFEKAIYGAVNLRNSYTTLRGTNFIDNTNLRKKLCSLTGLVHSQRTQDHWTYSTVNSSITRLHQIIPEQYIPKTTDAIHHASLLESTILQSYQAIIQELPRIQSLPLIPFFTK